MKEKKRSTWSYVFEFAGTRKIGFILSVVLASLSVFCQIIPYFIAADIIKCLFRGVDGFPAYANRCLLMVLFMLFKHVFHAASTTLSHKSTFFVLGEMRKRALLRLSQMSLGTVHKHGSGNLKNILVERIDSIETTLAHILPEFTSNALLSLLLLVVAFLVDWRIAIASLLTFPVGFVLYMCMMIDYRPCYERTVRATSALNDAAVEYIGGIEVIKVFGKVKGSYEKFSNAAKEAAMSYVDWMKKNSVYFSLSRAVIPSSLITVLPIGLLCIRSGSLTPEDFAFLIMVTMAIFEPLMTLMSYSDDIAVLKTVMGQIVGIIEERVVPRPDEDKAKPEGFGVSFDNISFSYGEKEVIHNVSLNMDEGRFTAIVGPSGSGKTTLARLLASFWDGYSGRISIGGVDIRDLSEATYRSMVAYVSQDNFLFDDTVMENIRIGRPSATDDEVMAAAKKCGCHEFISSLEDGYQTVVGGNGSHLSGGEAQRVSICRAMLKDAPILILDEATAYTDPESEAALGDAIKSLSEGKTLIVIAHRLSTIMRANRIYVMDKGSLAEEGTHQGLLAKHGLYEAMWKAHISSRDGHVGEDGNV